MKYLIVFTLIVATALAAPPKKQFVFKPAARPARSDDSSSAQIVKYENDNIGLDGYNFA